MFHCVVSKTISYVSACSSIYVYVYASRHDPILKNSFILSSVNIESTGVLPPEALFTEAVKILEDKCERVIADLS